MSLEELELELGISNPMWVRTTRRGGILLICLYVDVYSYWYESVCVVVAVLVCLDLLVPFIVLVMYVADDIVNTHLSVLWHPSSLPSCISLPFPLRPPTWFFLSSHIIQSITFTLTLILSWSA